MQHKIAWLVPYPIKGAGGHRTIFSHISNMAKAGHLCHVFVAQEQPHQDMSESTLRKIVEEYFGPCPAQFHGGFESIDFFDMAVATVFWTAEIVVNQVNAKHKVYFIQDLETDFNPVGDWYIKADASYRYGLIPVTIGRWLSHILQEKYGCKSNFFEFTADHNIYHPLESTVKEKALCAIYQPEKARRCPMIVRDTLATIKHHNPDITIYTYGCEEPPNFSFEHTHLGLLSIDECNRLYNKCTVGLCLSATNPSRIPFEMMAAGLPTVDFYGDNTIYDMPEGGILLAEKNASSLAGAIAEIIGSTNRQQRMREKCLQFMKNRPANLEYEQCTQHFEAILQEQHHPQNNLTPSYSSKPFSATLHIPASSPTEVIEKKADKMTFLRYLCENRISRALKILWRGYC